MLHVFPATFISTSEKIGVGLEKQAVNFLFQFHLGMNSPVFLFWLFFQCKMKVLSVIWTMNFWFNISNKTHCNLHLCWNTQIAKFPKYLFRGLKYLYRIWLTRPITPYGNIKPYGEKKANCQVSDYKAWLSLALSHSGLNSQFSAWNISRCRWSTCMQMW